MSEIVTDGEGQEFVLSTSGGTGSGRTLTPFGGSSLRSALGRVASVRGIVDDDANRSALVQGLVELGVVSSGRAQGLSREEVRTLAGDAFASGAFTLLPYERSLRPICDIDSSEPAEPLTEGMEEEEVQATHTLELELVDEDDEPVANEPYRVELPDGEVVQGRLNAQGRALLTGILASGNCRVTFPRLDESVWGPG